MKTFERSEVNACEPIGARDLPGSRARIERGRDVVRRGARRWERLQPRIKGDGADEGDVIKGDVAKRWGSL